MAGLVPGPARKPDHLRRRRNIVQPLSTEMTLPAEGRFGAPPAWPLSTPANEAELTLWKRLWKLPQAVAWEIVAYPDLVARFVRVKVVSDRRGAPYRLLNEVKAMEDRLGLSYLAMRKLGWKLSDPAPTVAESGPGNDKLLDIRDRLKAAD